jgi:hypothetical protein
MGDRKLYNSLKFVHIFVWEKYNNFIEHGPNPLSLSYLHVTCTPECKVQAYIINMYICES